MDIRCRRCGYTSKVVGLLNFYADIYAAALHECPDCGFHQTVIFLLVEVPNNMSEDDA